MHITQKLEIFISVEVSVIERPPPPGSMVRSAPFRSWAREEVAVGAGCWRLCEKNLVNR